MRQRHLQLSSLALWMLSFLLIVSGCRTTPKVDWESRVGNYTYDQAVLELGPPDKTTTLTDGTLVAEWYQGQTPGSSVGVGVGTGIGIGGVGVGVGHSVGSSGKGKYLRLMFDQTRKLTSWTILRR